MPTNIIRLLSLGTDLTVLATNRQRSLSAEEREGRAAEERRDVKR